eukprot:scaffold81472_cov20-Tisochrysis_lutea.AAC.3
MKEQHPARVQTERQTQQPLQQLNLQQLPQQQLMRQKRLVDRMQQQRQQQQKAVTPSPPGNPRLDPLALQCALLNWTRSSAHKGRSLHSPSLAKFPDGGQWHLRTKAATKVRAL